MPFECNDIIILYHFYYLEQMILSDVENHRRLVNELADRVANLEALCDYPGVADSLTDVQNRYAKVLDKARVSL